ncbi:hypothetical protein GCM10007989_31930 [Devosia pacifica]|uniref:DUF309 domain-containing protein n=1 Tax=Devosia pacifica TaxID=1335967 RepID=A0A918VY34_9HYPH|nr:DUF309 domain-containing protein [Devosia pacifica]GHA33328.1 hypothetical protein GCM10007989_31930 [Devosia pacifica]
MHSAKPSRLLPERELPPYAYLPGRFPHPVRDPSGHSFGSEHSAEVTSASEEFVWGADLFNQGFYWEAHEAWELLWQQAGKATAGRLFYKALILLAAAGVKLREGKPVPAARHYRRAAAHLRTLQERCAHDYETGLTLTVTELLAEIGQISQGGAAVPSDEPQPIFSFILSPSARRPA